MDEDITFNDVVKWCVIGFLILCLVTALILAWVNIFGPMFNQADYNNFNTSPTHLNAVAQKFSDDCVQLAQAKDSTTRKAIENDIYSVASTVVLNNVQMPDTTRSCVNSAIYDVQHP